MNNFAEEYRQIGKQLEKFHRIFNKMWEHGSPALSKSIDTACIEFDRKTGKSLRFVFNPDFWNSIDNYTKAFVIAHECSHGINKHGVRAKSLHDRADNDLINTAMDLAINHTLVNCFNFDRNLINNQEVYCWVDTVFPEQNISDNLSFEEYYELLADQKSENNQKPDENEESDEDQESDENEENEDQESDEDQENEESDNNQGSPKTIDNHDYLQDFDFEDLLEDMQEKINQFDIDSYNEKTKHSEDNPVGIVHIPEKKILYITEKWNKLVKTWKRIGYNPPDESLQWVMPNRRFSELPDDIIMPSDFDTLDSDYCKSKINAWIFVDVSPSCQHIWDQFLLAADTIPDKFFNKRLWVFASSCQEIKKRNSKYHVGSSTSFLSVSETVAIEINKGNIPDAIIMITDGDASHPGYPCPEKWHFFIDATQDLPDIQHRKSCAKNFMKKVPVNLKSFYLVDYFMPPACQKQNSF